MTAYQAEWRDSIGASCTAIFDNLDAAIFFVIAGIGREIDWLTAAIDEPAGDILFHLFQIRPPIHGGVKAITVADTWAVGNGIAVSAKRWFELATGRDAVQLSGEGGKLQAMTPLVPNEVAELKRIAQRFSDESDGWQKLREQDKARADAAEEREKDLAAKLAAIRDAPVPKMPKIFCAEFPDDKDGILADHDVCLAVSVRGVLSTLTRKIAALEAERDEWKSENLENSRLLGISGSVEARLRAENSQLKSDLVVERDSLARMTALADVQLAAIEAKGDAGGWIAVGPDSAFVSDEYNISWISKSDGVRYVSTAWHERGAWWNDAGCEQSYAHLNIDYYRPLPSPPQDEAKEASVE